MFFMFGERRKSVYPEKNLFGINNHIKCEELMKTLMFNM